MNEFKDDRFILIQKPVHLVQSGHFKRNVDNLNKKEAKKISNLIQFDYMGSFEFEMGGLRQSLKRMLINKDFYKVFVFKQYKDEKGNYLKVYAPYIFFNNVQNIVYRLAISGYGLQEYCSLHRHIVEDAQNDEHLETKGGSDFWWDIENDFFMFFEHTDKLMQAMDALLKKSRFQKSNATSVLKVIYLDLLTSPNSSLINDHTSIKDYQYDAESKMHFIEFFDEAPLENIFMEAMIIAKVSKEIVNFNINGIPFSINETQVLNETLMENGINLVDSSTFSHKINELMTQYNEEIQRRQKGEELVQVLKLVQGKKEE